MRWEGHVERMGEKKKVYRSMVGNRPIGRKRRRWVDIKVDLEETL
jgi:hypothetical protein